MLYTIKNSALFLTGALLYPVIELLWRGHTHYSMAIAGGVCLCALNHICSVKMRHRSIILRCLCGAAAITLVEFVFGVVFNIWLGMKVWDYSALPMNLLGQVALPFTALWALLCFPAIKLAEFISDKTESILLRKKAKKRGSLGA